MTASPYKQLLFDIDEFLERQTHFLDDKIEAHEEGAMMMPDKENSILQAPLIDPNPLMHSPAVKSPRSKPFFDVHRVHETVIAQNKVEITKLTDELNTEKQIRREAENQRTILEMQKERLISQKELVDLKVTQLHELNSKLRVRISQLSDAPEPPELCTSSAQTDSFEDPLRSASQELVKEQCKNELLCNQITQLLEHLDKSQEMCQKETKEKIQTLKRLRETNESLKYELNRIQCNERRKNGGKFRIVPSAREIPGKSFNTKNRGL